MDADAGNRFARFEPADALLSTGRFQDSAKHFQKLTELDPGDLRCWQGLGFSYLGLARRAFEALEKAAPGSGCVCWPIRGNSSSRIEAHLRFTGKRSRAIPIFPAFMRPWQRFYRGSGHGDWAAVEDQREHQLPELECSSAPAQCISGRSL